MQDNHNNRRRARENRKLGYLIELYHKAHPEEDPARVSPEIVAPWALREGVWEHQPIEPETMLRRKLSRHLRSSYSVDPQGRTVREHHAVVYEDATPDGGISRRSEWYKIFDATPNHMQTSLQVRRRSALQDVLQLETDRRSYNDNNKHGATLEQMDFDYNKDIEELDQPTSYPDAPFPGDLDEDDDEGV